MRIAEIFHSIQGEGTLVGVPSVFVRTSGCNLRCTWCDTPYTSWTPEGPEMSLDQIVDSVEQFHCAHVVVTGGEPMLFPAVVDLTKELRTLGLHVTIETAGTVWQPVACDLMSISPKLANSTPVEREGGKWADRHNALRYQPQILKQLMTNYNYQLKFVVSSPDDLPEIDQIVAETCANHDRVLLMPEGTNAEVVRERGRWLAEIVKRSGYRYSPRLHVDLWGDVRGV
ncbi:MAG: 7-carboxy-7-deazaguanine synthase QueE [Acidobacteriota bacterium]